MLINQLKNDDYTSTILKNEILSYHKGASRIGIDDIIWMIIAFKGIGLKFTTEWFGVKILDAQNSSRNSYL